MFQNKICFSCFVSPVPEVTITLNTCFLLFLTGALKGTRPFLQQKRMFKKERELIQALRRTQKEEARALEHQRELLEKLRAANAREAAADREEIESLRKAQQEEAKELNAQREELQREKAELQKKWEELQQLACTV